MTARMSTAARRLGGLLAASAMLATACTTARPADGLVTAEVGVLGSAETTTIATLAAGKPAVVNFWASWCEFCIDEMPDLEVVWRDLSDELVFVGVDREDRPDLALELAAETGVTYPLVEDPDGSLFREGRGLGMPTTLFVSAQGEVVHRHSGPVTASQLRELIATHLGPGA